jgi:hypothetical protein
LINKKAPLQIAEGLLLFVLLPGLLTLLCSARDRWAGLIKSKSSALFERMDFVLWLTTYVNSFATQQA